MYPIFPFAHNAMFGVLEGVAQGVRGLMGAAGVILYVLRAVGLYRICCNTGVARPWFAWIPFLHEYQCAKIGDRTRLAQGRGAFLEKGIIVSAALYILLNLVESIFGGVFLIGWIVTAACWCAGVLLWAVSIAADYWLYTDFEPSLRMLYTILSVVRLDGIPKIVIRDNVPVGIAGMCSPRQPRYTQSGAPGPGAPNGTNPDGTKQ